MEGDIFAINMVINYQIKMVLIYIKNKLKSLEKSHCW